MGILTSLMRPETRASVEGPLPLTAARVLDWINGEPTAAGVNVSVEGSLKLAAVWAAVRVISEDVASLPLITYKRLPRGKERATGHRLYRILHDEPNPYMTAMQFRETLQAHILTWGNAYANIERDDNGRPVALWPLRPDQMGAPVVSEAGTLLYTYRMPSGEPRALTQSDVFHLRGLSPDGMVGYSPIRLQRETLALGLATTQYGSRFFANDSRPGGVLQAKTRLTKDAADRMKASWEAAHRGLTNAHRVAVLEEGVEWKQIGLPPDDAQWMAARDFQIQEVGRIFRVTPYKLGDLSHATYSNIETLSIQYVTDTLRSWLVRWEQQANKDLLLPAERGRYYTEHLMDALLRGETMSRFQSYQLGMQNGIYSPNEVREFENMNPFEGGDTHLQMSNMVPYGTLPEPKVAPAEPKRTQREIRKIENGYVMTESEVNDGKL